jgi:hypothetical protein
MGAAKKLSLDKFCVYSAFVISDVSDMPWGCPQFCVAAVSQKLLQYNIIAFSNNLKLKLYNNI